MQLKNEKKKDINATSQSSKHYMFDDWNEEILIWTLKQSTMSVTHKTDFRQFFRWFAGIWENFHSPSSLVESELTILYT